MAAGTPTLYNNAIKKLGDATTFDLSDTTGWTIGLFGTAGAQDFDTRIMSLVGSITDEAAGGGYAAKALSSEVWVSVATNTYKFDAADVVFTASGSAISGIAGFVIYASGASAGAKHVLCFGDLTSTAFTLATGNTLTISWNANGIFTAANG